MATKAKKKIMIGIPVASEFIKAKTAFSLVHALKNIDCEYDLQIYMSGDIIGGRSGLVKRAIEGGNTHILFIDWDMFFAPGSIQQIIDLNLDVVGAPYNMRKLPIESTAVPLTEATTTIPYKVKSLGAGFLLINLDVFKKIEHPFFNFGRSSDGEMVYGEDTWFANQCIKAGIDVWVDPTLQITHLGEYAF